MLDVQIASSAEVMRQASMTANDYMLDAKAMIDAAFGTDYAYEHPELVAAFMRTAAQDFHTAMNECRCTGHQGCAGRCWWAVSAIHRAVPERPSAGS